MYIKLENYNRNEKDNKWKWKPLLNLTLASYWSEFISAINLAIAFSVSSNFLRNFSISINLSVSRDAVATLVELEVAGVDDTTRCCWCNCCWCFNDEDRLEAADCADRLALYKSLALLRCWCWCCCWMVSGYLSPKNLYCFGKDFVRFRIYLNN